MMTKAIVPIKESRLKQFMEDSLPDLHNKQYLSLSRAVQGVLKSGSLMVSQIGQGLAQSQGLKSKHAIKQIDRLLSNEKLDSYNLQNQLARMLIANRTRIHIAIDWTVFAKDE